jgi:hypothetical protein
MKLYSPAKKPLIAGWSQFRLNFETQNEKRKKFINKANMKRIKL